ncbi:MAG: hypothetical protein HW421_3098 [Ignavibacteria bacterium]|nr:hypothetical protein [Ignavibacteria bacterium]
MHIIQIKKSAEKRIRSGHQWIFSNELNTLPQLPAGSLVRVHTSTGKDLGIAFYNRNSLISLRLLNYFEDIDNNFFLYRIKKANEFRKQILPNENSYRLIYGESDGLPGLIADKYENYLSLQFLAAGMDNLKEQVVSVICELFPNFEGIIEKNFSQHRLYEGLEQNQAILFGNIPGLIQIKENGIKYNISLTEGQKTGYFFDQRDNRLLLKKISNGKNVLDCFTYQGSFALNAIAGGAASALGIDSSQTALDFAESNSALNNYQNLKFIRSDVVEELERQSRLGAKWDIINLDPPAYSKNKKSVPVALKGYGKLARLALRLIVDEGYLCFSSCSQHVSEQELLNVISNEASKLSINLSMLYRGGQAADHPVLLSMPETSYLKFFVFRVVR